MAYEYKTHQICSRTGKQYCSTPNVRFLATSLDFHTELEDEAGLDYTAALKYCYRCRTGKCVQCGEEHGEYPE